MNTTSIAFPSNKVDDIRRTFLCRLRHLYPQGEIEMFLRILFHSFLGWDHVDLLTQRQHTVNQSDLLRFHWALYDLLQYKPIQYIVGNTSFLGCNIVVDQNTLIPRPETEELLQLLFNTIHTPPQNILDLCTGSGCIAIALAKQWPNANVEAVDISDKALAVASKNAQHNNVNILFRQADITEQAFQLQDKTYDLIVSNPPYVMEKERQLMSHNVLDWEPPQALFVPDNDPLRFYHSIAAFAAQTLSPYGLLALEINEQFGSQTSQLLQQYSFATQLIKDFKDNNRFLLCTSTKN